MDVVIIGIVWARVKISPLSTPSLLYITDNSSNLLELFKRLPAIAAVIDSPAQGWPEGVFEGGLARAAVGALGHGQELDQVAARGHLAGGGRGEARTLEGLPAALAHPVGGPGFVQGHFHGDGVAGG